MESVKDKIIKLAKNELFYTFGKLLRADELTVTDTVLGIFENISR